MTEIAHSDCAVIVMAAGRGERMKAVGEKVLLQVAGKPLFGYAVDLARNFKPAETVVALSETTIEEGQRYLKNSEKVVTVAPLGSLGAAEVAIQKLSSTAKDILICQADDAAFYPPDVFDRLYERFCQADVNIAITTVTITYPLSLGSIQTDSAGFLTSIDLDRELPSPKTIISGIYLMKHDLLTRYGQTVLPNEKGERSIAPSWLMQAIAAGEKIATLELPEGEWCNINTPEDLERARARKESNA